VRQSPLATISSLLRGRASAINNKGAVQVAAKDNVVDPERAAMADPKTFSIKGLPLSYIIELIVDWGGVAAIQDLTTTQICERFLKPITEQSGLSLCAQLFLSNAQFKGNPLVQDASWFISHAWQYKFTETIDSILAFAKTENLDPSTMIIWFDLFSNSQHNTAAKPFDWWQTVFMNAIKSIHNVVMVIHPWENPIPLKRVWCIFEVYACTITSSNFHIAMTSQEELTFIDALHTPERFHTVLANINSHKSESWNPSDRDSIFEVIQQTVGFVALDRLVFDTISNWVLSSIQKLMKPYDKESETYLILMAVLGGCLRLQGRYQEAEEILEKCVERWKRVFGANEPNTFSAMNFLGLVYQEQGKLADALPIFTECLEGQTRLHGTDDLRTLRTMNHLGMVYQNMGNFKEAESIFRECRVAATKLFGETDLETLRYTSNLAHSLQTQSKFSEAEPLLIQCLSVFKTIHGPDHPSTLLSMLNLGLFYISQKDFIRAEELLQECLETRKRVLGPEHPDTINSHYNIIALRNAEGNIPEASRLTVQLLQDHTNLLSSSYEPRNSSHPLKHWSKFASITSQKRTALTTPQP
ncbi:TPR-like protein, partial [Rhizoclosmatium globosum]